MLIRGGIRRPRKSRFPASDLTTLFLVMPYPRWQAASFRIRVEKDDDEYAGGDPRIFENPASVAEQYMFFFPAAFDKR